jgi:hypothetical protein
LEPRVPFRFDSAVPATQHVVVSGESWWTIAARYWAELPYAAQLWWILPDFQPSPVVDPTLALRPGSVVYVPTLRVVTEQILSDARLAEEVL